MSHVLGIDLGTTFSAVSFVDENGNPTIVKNEYGATMTPSVVLLDGDRVEVGQTAMNQWITNQDKVIRWIKRAMDQDEFRFQDRSAIEISAEILKVLKRDAEEHLGVSIDEAVITCPAYFQPHERENTQKAGELAGFKAPKIIAEPTAAAVFHGVQSMREGEKIMVCDLGGGTFDATILALEKDVYVPKATVGNRKLGGHDWTEALVNLTRDRLLDLYGFDVRDDLGAMQMLYENCEQAKRDFHQRMQATISCPYEGKLHDVEVSRQEFEELTQYLMDRMSDCCNAAINKANVKWSDLKEILLVGGSSRLRRMGEEIAKLSGRKPIPIREPDLAVAYGAAIIAKGEVRVRPRGGIAARGSGISEVKRVTTIATIPRHFGTRVAGKKDGQSVTENEIIIPMNTVVPASCSRDDFAIPRDDLHSFDIPVVEFEPHQAGNCVAYYRVSCLPNVKRGDRIRVTFHYDESGILKAEAADVASGMVLVCENMGAQFQPEPTASGPRYVIFAVDASGSMYGEKLQSAKNALIKNAKELINRLGDNCKIGIVSFGSNGVPVLDPVSNIDMIEEAANGIEADGGTAMDEGLDMAMTMAAIAPADSMRDIVMISDGMPNSKERALVAAAKCTDSGIILSSLRIDSSDTDNDYLNQLTPNYLDIESGGDMTSAVATLLTRADEARSGQGAPVAAGVAGGIREV